jgi:hypothetical protein
MLMVADRLCRPLARAKLFPKRVLARMATRRAVWYALDNALDWSIPERLRRYDGLAKLVARARSLGSEFYSLPPGWFGGHGDVACTYLLDDRAYVFFEDRPIDLFELSDTIAHEIVHATALQLRDAEQPARATPAYWHEEAIAIVAAQRLAAHFEWQLQSKRR